MIVQVFVMTFSFFSRRYDKVIAALAVPALGSLATDPLVSLVDTAFVGRLGAAPLAALGINVALFSLYSNRRLEQ